MRRHERARPRRAGAGSRRRLPTALAAGLVAAGGVGGAGLAGAFAFAGAAPSASFTVTGPMHTPRAGATATVLQDGDVLVAGGQDSSGNPLASAELYHPSSGSWTGVAPLPVAVSQATATRLDDGDVLVAGGLTTSGGNLQASGASQLFDPRTGQWRETSRDLQTASYGASAGLLANGQVLYAGGLTSPGNGATATAVAELYDPSHGTWSATGSLPVAVARAASARLSDGAILVAGGETGASGGLTDVAEIYRAGAHGFAPVDHLDTPVAEAATTVLGDHDVLVAGGETSTGGAPTSAVQRFDPNTGNWNGAASLPFASYGATATTLPSGEVVYAGGLTSGSGNPTNDAALFDPSSNGWSSTGNMAVARGFATSAPVGHGQVLVAGGLTAHGVTGEAERFSLAAPTSAPAFTTPASRTLHAGQFTRLAVSATGAPTPHLHERGHLPPGLRFEAHGNGTATIVGRTPRRARGTYKVAIVAANGVGRAAVQHLVLSFVEPLAIEGPTTRTLQPGKEAHVVIKTNGSPAPRLVEQGALPPGLRFVAGKNGTAAIEGVPGGNVSGTYRITVTASNGVEPSAVKHLVLRFNQAPAFTTPASLSVKDGHGVHFTVHAAGLPVPHLSVHGGLPPGLHFYGGHKGVAVIAGKPAPRARGTYAVTVTAANGVGKPASQRLRIKAVPSVFPRGLGYWYATTSGRILWKGAARPIAAHHREHPRRIVDMAKTPGGGGYYLVSSYGGVFNYGNARFYGSIAHRHLRTRTVAIAVPSQGNGYYEVTRAGNVFAYGDAHFYGSEAGKHAPPIAAFAPTPDGHGYWLVTVRGNVYGFGDAHFFGSPPHSHARIGPSVVAFGPTPDGHGYWVVTRNGGVFAYGNAHSYGSLANRRIPPVTAFAPTADGHGYWLVTRRGNVFNLGDARFFGSSAHRRLPGSVTGFSPDFSG